VSTREDERSLLERRARVLARPHSQPTPARTLQARMRFEAGGEAFALDLDDVAAVARPLGFTALPGTTAPLVGVAVWRGRVISVLDAAGLHGGRTAPSGATVLMIVLAGGRTAVLADSSPEIAALSDSVRAATAGRATYVKAVLPDGTALLNGAALRGDELTVQEDHE
jgi:chemotaxis signal transduction protein